MLIGFFVILLILWIAGMVAGFLIKGFIHILLVIAIIALVLHFVRGRKGNLINILRTPEVPSRFPGRMIRLTIHEI